MKRRREEEGKPCEDIMVILSCYGESDSGVYDEADFIEECVGKMEEADASIVEESISDLKMENESSVEMNLGSEQKYGCSEETETLFSYISEDRDRDAVEDEETTSSSLVIMKLDDSEDLKMLDESQETVDLSPMENLTDPVSVDEALRIENCSEESCAANDVSCMEGEEDTCQLSETHEGVTVRRMYLEPGVSMMGSRILQGSGSVRNGEPEVIKVMLFNGYRTMQESTSGLSIDTDTREEAFEVLREAEKRSVERERVRLCGNQPRRFVIDKDENYMSIEDAFKLNEFRTKSLMGKIHKKGGNGRYQHNWFTLREGFFTCYGGKRWKVTNQNIPSDRDGDLRDPADASCFFKKKYTLDLLSTTIYLVKPTGCFGCLRWQPSFSVDENLVDITDDMKIVNVTQVRSHFMVSLKKDLVKTEMRMKTLDFALRSQDGLYFYRCSDVNSFLRWIVAFAFRQGRITCNIG